MCRGGSIPATELFKAYGKYKAACVCLSLGETRTLGWAASEEHMPPGQSESEIVGSNRSLPPLMRGVHGVV